MTKHPLIFVAKPSRLGDIITYLPFLTYIRKKHPNCYTTFYIDKSCSQIIPFLINNKEIDNIRVSEKPDKITDGEQRDVRNTYEIIFNPYPQITRPDYYNFHSVQKENFIMSEVLCKAGWCKILASEYDLLTEYEKFPKLTPWLDIKREEKTIAIWPQSGYNNSDPSIKQRSPNNDFWFELRNKLSLMGYTTKIYGLGAKFCMFETNLSLFDSIKESLGADLCITTDSGSGHIISAYGQKHICLYTNWSDGHTQNLTARLPMNYKNNLFPIFGAGGINNIKVEEVLDKIKEALG